MECDMEELLEFRGNGGQEGGKILENDVVECIYRKC